MKVVFTEEARASLAHIGDFIAEDNPERAFSFTEELRAKAMNLVALPQGFPLVPRYEDRGIRRRSYRGYGILYVMRGDYIIILRFLGPGQDHERLLGFD